LRKRERGERKREFERMKRQKGESLRERKFREKRESMCAGYSVLDHLRAREKERDWGEGAREQGRERERERGYREILCWAIGTR
jgi:hypothetical protein